SDGFIGELEANLVVAFASAAVGKAIGAEFQRDFGLTLGDDGTRHGSAEEISVFVNGSRAERGPDEIADEFFSQVFDGRGRSASGESFFVCGLKIFLLTDVADHGDDFAVVIFLEPGNDDAGIESAGIGQHDFLRFWISSIHNSSFIVGDMRNLAVYKKPYESSPSRVWHSQEWLRYLSLR